MSEMREGLVHIGAAQPRINPNPQILFVLECGCGWKDVSINPNPQIMNPRRPRSETETKPNTERTFISLD